MYIPGLDLSPLFLCSIIAALHPWIRLDLGLPLYWGMVQLQPAAAEPIIVHLETVALREIVIEDAAPSVPPWRLPHTLQPHYYAEIRLWNVCPFQDTDQWILPVDSIIPLSCLQGEADSEQDESGKLLRIISKAEHGSSTSSFGESILVMEKVDRTWLLQHFDKSTRHTNSASGISETLTRPETNELMDISLPRFSLPSTTIWSEPVLTEMKTKKATMLILCGPTGSGKTHNSLVLSGLARLEQQKATLYLDCKRLQESAVKILDILIELDALFEQAVKARSCLIVLDDLDRLAPNLLSGDEGDPSARVHSANPTAVDQSKLISDRILQLMEAVLDSRELTKEDMDLSIVITCSGESSLNSSLLQSSSVFQRSIDVPTLSTQERLEVLGQMIECLRSHPSTFDVASIGPRTEGFRPRDLAKIASRLQRQLSSIIGEISMDKALDLVLDDFTPLSHLSLSRPQMSTGLDWSDIGGLFEVKAKLESTVLHPARYRSIYSEANIRLPRGIFLFGPPGCGKSALVPALAKECNFPLIACKGPEILDKYIGASEAKVRELFSRASAVAPSILFLDELDALAPRRGSDNTGVTDRVVNQLLTFLDGVEDASTGTVYVIGATSRPDKVDPALLRPGRLEQHLFIGPPESGEGWTDLFSKVAKNWNFSLECQQAVSSKAKALDLLNTVTDNSRFSPADMRSALDTAHINAVHRTLKTAAAEDVEKVEITEEDLRLALRKARPCLNEDDANVLEEVNRPFRKHKKDARSEGGERSTGLIPAKLKTTLR
jgi:SpoVK/Ycf46/Vps4 family AAA+-type ATPase